MKAGNTIRILAAVAVIGLAAACEQTPLAVDDQPAFAALSVPSAAITKIQLCKDGPAGYDFPFSAVGSTTNDLTLYNGGNPFTLQGGQCVDAATTVNGGGLSVVFTEGTPPAETVFDSVVVFNIGNNRIYASSSNATTPPVYFGRDNGAVVVYYNSRLPSTGCTATLGYWKTHSEYGPAGPYDATWAAVGGPDEPFFGSGQTWFEVFWTSPQGNAYYNLAHQYMAAQLNLLAGASSTAAVDAAIAAATTLFGTYTPAQVAALAKNSALRAQFLSLATTLDNYNNGLIGPGHCSD